MCERAIEQKLVQAAKARGGIAAKLVSPGSAGVPDRLVLLPGGRMGFVETKAPGKKPRPLQARWHERLQRLGFKVYVIDDVSQIETALEEIENG